jgi:hypothetical protein
MIANSVELWVAVRNLRILEKTLGSLREELQAKNPLLLEAASKAYVHRIAALQEAIAKYLGDHPTEVSLILPPLERAVAAMTSPLTSAT